MIRSLVIAVAALSLGCSKSDPHASPAAEDSRPAPQALPDKPAPGEGAPRDAVTAPSPSSAAAPPSERKDTTAAPADPLPAARPTSPLAAASAAPSAAAPPSAALAPPSAAVPSAPPAASAVVDDAKTVMSAKTTEPTFNLWMQSAGKYKAGQQGAVQVVLVAKGEYHCNDKYPYKFKLSAPPAGVSYPQPVVRVEAMSITPARSVMSVPVLPSAPGEAKVSGTFSFSVCSAASCQLESRELSLNIKIE